MRARARDPDEASEALHHHDLIGAHLIEAGEEQDRDQSADHQGPQSRGRAATHSFGRLSQRIERIRSPIFSHGDSIGTAIGSTSGQRKRADPPFGRPALVGGVRPLTHYQFRRAPNRMTRGATRELMRFAFEAFWVRRML